METSRARLVLWALILLSACAEAASESPLPSVPPTPIAPAITPILPSATLARASFTPTVSGRFITPPANNDPAIVPILMYHHIEDLPPMASELDLTWTVSPENFRAQMDYLAQRGYQTITMPQLVAHLKERKPLPAKSIIISLDDGWGEGYAVAFPVLKRYNFGGTYYVYTNPLDRSRYLSRAQLREMVLAGMDIQAHTLSHPHLRLLAPDAAYNEIADSRNLLEKEIGTAVTSFAYPFGEYNSAVIEMVKRAGFQSAVTIASGYRQRASELHTLPRIRVSYRDTLKDFAARLPMQ